MRSGNGRHRRPRQAPALFVTAGVTGAGLAMPLLAAGSAQAADGATWDRVASCESGGLWSANSGNGYYGGLQLTLQTWEEYGGTALADRPDLASRSQQIEVAEKILDDRGPGAWPTCSVSAGLLPEDADLPDAPDSPDVEVPDVEVPDLPGVPDGETPAPDASDGSGLPEAPEGSSDPAGSGGDSASPAPAPEPSQDAGTGTGSGVDGGTDGTDGAPTTQPTTQPTPSPTAPADDAEEADADGTDGERKGRHRGSPDDETRGEGDRSSRGRHGNSGEDGRQDGYLVRPGDSLSEIAAEQDVRGGWTELYETNRETVGPDPDLILPGQRLEL